MKRFLERALVVIEVVVEVVKIVIENIRYKKDRRLEK